MRKIPVELRNTCDMFKNGGKTKRVHPPRAFANVSPTLLRSCAAVIARIDSGIIKVYSEVHTQPPRSRMSDTGAPKTCTSARSRWRKVRFRDLDSVTHQHQAGPALCLRSYPRRELRDLRARPQHPRDRPPCSCSRVPDLVPFVISSINGDATRPSKSLLRT